MRLIFEREVPPWIRWLLPMLGNGATPLCKILV